MKIKENEIYTITIKRHKNYGLDPLSQMIKLVATKKVNGSEKSLDILIEDNALDEALPYYISQALNILSGDDKNETDTPDPDDTSGIPINEL